MENDIILGRRDRVYKSREIPGNDIIPKHIINFLSSEEGMGKLSEIVDKISGTSNKYTRYNRKEHFLNPTKSIIQWVKTLELLMEEYENTTRSNPQD